MPTPRKSAAAHWLSGTKSQATAPDTTPMPAGRCRYPRNFTTREKSIFLALAKRLAERSHETKGDQALLEMTARVWSRWQTALDHLRAEGEIVQVETYGKDGQPLIRMKPNPWLAVAQQAERELLKFLVQLGLTPQTRSRIDRTAPTAPEELSDEAAFSMWQRSQGQIARKPNGGTSAN